MAITDNIIYRLKAEAGDTEPHDETGTSGDLTGGTITLVDRGGGDWAWQFEGGLATLSIPTHNIVASTTGTGLMMAVTLRVATYPTTDSPIVSYSADTNGGNGIHIGRFGAGSLRVRQVNELTATIGATATSVDRTYVARIDISATSAQDFVRVWLETTGRVGTDADVSSPGGNLANRAFDTLNIHATDSAVIQIKDLVIWSVEPANADAAAVADDLRGTLDAEPADETAPTLTSPSGSATGSTTASGSVDTDEGNGTLYAVCTTSATPPTAEQVQAGEDDSGAAAAYATSQAVSGTGTQNVNASGLSPETAYYWHFQHQDAAANDSAVSTSSSFTTDEAPAPGGGAVIVNVFGF